MLILERDGSLECNGHRSWSTVLVKLHDLGSRFISRHPVMDEQLDESHRSIVETEDAAE